ncbi:hypothetical protein MRX96_024708 [Rhipicephalus microplus]
MHKFRHYDGIAYVSASLSRELVSIEKTVLMNYGTDRSEVICRTYVRKTLISEKVAYNLEDAKQVLDCAESLHPCRGAGRAKDFTYDVLTKKLEQQISHSDGLVFSVTCKGAVKQQGGARGRAASKTTTQGRLGHRKIKVLTSGVGRQHIHAKVASGRGVDQRPRSASVSGLGVLRHASATDWAYRGLES